MRREIILIVALFILISSAFYLLISDIYEKQKILVLQDEKEQISIVYKAVSNMYGISLSTIVKNQVLTPEIVDIMEKADKANAKNRTHLRGQLYRKLWKLYENELIPLSANQFQFHLKNSESFLRYIDPSSNGDNLSKFRKTVNIANRDKVYTYGFEGGHTSPGFRHVYPIQKGDKHVGSVEISLSFEALRKEMSKLLPKMDIFFIMKKRITIDMVSKKNKERFLSTHFAKDFVIENPIIAKLDDDYSNKINAVKEYLLSNPNENQIVIEQLNSGKSFSFVIKNSIDTYGCHFVPIYDTSGKLAAYIVGYNQAPSITTLEKQKQIATILGIVGLLILFIALFFLIKHRKKTILQKNEIETIAHTIKSGLMVINENGALTFINDGACMILGYQKEELMGRLIHGKIHYHADKDVICPILNVGITGTTYTGEEQFIKKNGTIFPVAVSSAPLVSQNKITGSVTIFRDITNEKNEREKIKKLAYHDSLTNLPNRKLFFDQLEQCMEKSMNNRVYCGIIYVDLDDFKHVNDSYGHKIGDELLINVAQRISSNIRSNDTLARLGGDEFAIIIKQLDGDYKQAKKVFAVIVKKVFTSLSENFSLSGKIHKCNASMGAIVFKGKKRTADEIVEIADAAMYRAKKSGKNSYIIDTK